MQEVLQEIGGESVPAASGEWFESTNPAADEPLFRVARGGAEDVARAYASADAAQRTWGALSGEDRAAILYRYADVLAAHGDELAELDAREGGNPVKAMRGDVDTAVRAVRYFAGLATELKGSTYPGKPGVFTYTRMQPYGVTARLLAYNHPLMFAIRGLAATVAAGNSVILKPSELTNASTVRIAQLWRGLGPEGLINVVTGYGAEVGDELVRHPGIKRLSFTGGVETGRRVLTAAAAGMKVVTLELGGKNPFIVLPDADTTDLVQAAIDTMNFTWSLGQSCQSMSRLFLHESLYDEVVPQIVEKVRALRPGDPLDPDNTIGSLVSQAAWDRVDGFVRRAEAEGATIAAGGRRPEGFDKGAFYAPTIVLDAAPDSEIATTEIFGPVQCIFKWSTEEQVIALANAVPYGLTANVWTKDLGTAQRFVEQLESGVVWVNGRRAATGLAVPMGGFKDSGIGREKAIEELLSFAQIKAVQVTAG